MSSYKVRVEEFRDTEDLNFFLEDIPGEDVISITVLPGMVSVVYKQWQDKPRKSRLVESSEEVDYDSESVNSIMSNVNYFGADTCAEMLDVLRSMSIYSKECLLSLIANGSAPSE